MAHENEAERIAAALERIADALEGGATVAPRSGGTGNGPPPPHGGRDGGG